MCARWAQAVIPLHRGGEGFPDGDGLATGPERQELTRWSTRKEQWARRRPHSQAEKQENRIWDEMQGRRWGPGLCGQRWVVMLVTQVGAKQTRDLRETLSFNLILRAGAGSLKILSRTGKWTALPLAPSKSKTFLCVNHRKTTQARTGFCAHLDERITISMMWFPRPPKITNSTCNHFSVSIWANRWIDADYS